MGLRGANILVTGGTGFIGSHLVENLLGLECNIIVPYQSLNPKSYFFSQNLNNKVLLVNTDIKNFKRTFDVVTKYEVDFVFHLAAQSIIPTAYYNPLETLETNFMGTANVLEAARLYSKVRGVIVVSSDKAYGKIPRASEENPLSGDHPYEASKAAADFLVGTYFKTYSLPSVVVRFGNVYGHGDINFSRIIPATLTAIIKNRTLEIRSDGKYVRDYVYIEDVVGALITIVKNINGVKGEAFNISSTENLSVIEIVKLVSKIVNRKIKYKIMNTAVNEIPVQSINFNKIKKTLGWKPKESLNSTIPDIYDWYKKYFEDKS